jgi:hypothetical protein
VKSTSRLTVSDIQLWKGDVQVRSSLIPALLCAFRISSGDTIMVQNTPAKILVISIFAYLESISLLFSDSFSLQQDTKFIKEPS